MTTSIRAMAREAGIDRSAIYKRVAQGMTVEQAIADAKARRRGPYTGDRGRAQAMFAERQQQAEINRLMRAWK